MSTVNCPNCNKPNIEGSKFCNSCGSALPPSTHIVCPTCGTRNPKNLLYCDNCGTRLLATSELSSRRVEEKEPEEETRTPRAFSLPTRDPGDELEEDNLLDWLRTGEKQPETESADSTTEPEAVVGDWLNDLSDVESSKPEADEALPDWFQGAGETEEDAVSADLADWFSESDEAIIEEGGLADWLSELDEDEEEGEQAEVTSPDEAIPDWLSELEDDSSQETVEGDTTLPGTDILSPDDLSSPDIGDTLITSSPLQEAEEEIPEWFSNGGDDEKGNRPVEELAEWLSEFDDEDEAPTLIEAAPEQAGEDDLPEWLSSLEDKPPVEKAEETLEAEELPEWLSERLDEGTPTLIGATPEEAAEEEALPDWLSETAVEELPTQIESIETETPDEQEALPDWLSESMEEPETSEPDSAEAELLPDWLAETAVEDEPPTLIESFEAPGDEEELPDWLSESVGETETAEPEIDGAESLPDWLAETAVEEEQPPFVESVEQPAAEGELPDWLSEFTGDEEADEPDLAEFLSEMEEEEPASDWLSEFDDDEEPLVAQETIEETAEADALPDWLSEFGDDEEPIAETAEEESLTDWLSDFADEDDSPTADDTFIEMGQEEVVSDWLSSFDLPGEDEDKGVAEAVGDDWLDDTAEEEPTVEEAATSMVEDTSEMEAEDDSLESDLPDWLSEMPSYDTRILSAIGDEEDETADIFADFEEASLGPVDALPDWLAEIAPEEETAEDELVEEAAAEAEDDGLPDWLSDLPDQAETFEEDEDEDTDWLAALTMDEPWPETADEEEIAAQVDELGTGELAPPGFSHELQGVPKELAGSDLPDWLQEDMPPSDRGAQKTEEDLFGVGVGEEIAAGELPDWLQQMKPATIDKPAESTELDFDFASVETQDEWQDILENMPASPGAIPGVDELNAAEIPAWLQALKPRDFGKEEEELPESDEPPETTGPLAGLRGVLPIAAVVADPMASKTPAPYTISKEQQQQIALLHRLTHEEPEAVKQVAVKKAATFSTPWRALLGILLLLVVLAGVLLPGTDIGLPETVLPVPDSAFNAFEQMNGVSGRTVLVAIEYTPAMAGELDPIALMLMRQLAENGNRVVTISQSAVGTAIADQLVEEVDGLQGRALPVLTGEAVGLRSLAACLSNAAENCGPLYDTSDAELVGDLGNIGLVIVLTSDRNSLVNWIEQVESEIDAPVIAAVTQPLGPLTIPYISSGQLEGTLNGIPAASAYEKRLRGIEGSAFQQFTAQTIVMWVVIISLIVAAVVYGTAGLAESRTKKGGE